MNNLDQIEFQIIDAKEEYGVLIREVITLKNERNNLTDEIKTKRSELAKMDEEFIKKSLRTL